MADISAKIQDWYKEAEDADVTWRAEALEDEEFYLGAQWTAAEIAKMDAKARPHLVINRILPLVNLVSGFQRTHRQDPKVYPAEDGDETTANTLNSLVNDTFKSDDVQFKESHAFLRGAVGGRGWLHGYIDTTLDPLGEPRIVDINPFHMLYDPHSVQLDLEDATYVIRCAFLSEERMRQKFPDVKLSGGMMWNQGALEARRASDEYDTQIYERRSSYTARPYMLREVWYKDYHIRHYIYDLGSGELVRVRSKTVGKRFENENPQRIVYFSRNMYDVKWATELSGAILAEGNSPYGNRAGFPYFPYFANFFAGESFGLVRALKDPQREINKRRSLAIEQLITKARNIAIAKGIHGLSEDELEKKLKKFGGVIEVGPNGEIVAYEPAGTPSDIIGIERLSIEDLKAISGINADLLGMSTAETQSGRAIALRQQQGMTILGGALDNFRLTKKMAAQWLIYAIQATYTYSKVVRVVGEDGLQKRVGLNEKVRDIQGNVERILNDVTIGRYDVRIGEAPQSPTMRIANFMMLMDMVNAGVPIPWQVLIEASDLPDKQRILEVVAASQAQGGGAPQPGGQQGAGKSPYASGNPQIEANESARRSQLAAQGIGSFARAG